MINPARISPDEVRARQQQDESVLLINIYPQHVFDRSHLDGAISYQDFTSRLPTLPKETALVFY